MVRRRSSVRAAARAVAAAFTLVTAALPVPRALASPFGICAHVPDEPVLDRLEAAGIRWIRIDLAWPVVQPERDTWNWTVFDRLVASARERGFEIYATLSETPAWATDGPPVTGPPRDPADWARFCYRAAARYRGLVRAWGMWNEPNLDRFWTGTRAEYIERIVLPGADAIHAADPLAIVGAPDTAHLHSADWDRWLRDVARDAGDRLDVITHHVYSPNGSHRPVSSALDRPPANPWDDPSVRQVLQKAGWFGRPFWLTETGMASDVHGEADQAGFYTNLLEDWFRPGTDLNWMGRIFFYEAADDPSADHAWGILGPPPEYEPKPAYFAYADFIETAQVSDAALVAASGRTFMRPGEVRTAEVTFRNTGTVVWTALKGYRLAPVADPAGLVRSGLTFDPGLTVAPGQAVAFTVSLAAPAEAVGPSLVVLRMRGPDGQLFGDALRAVVTVTAEAPPSIVRQPSPHTVPHGVPVRFEVVAESETPVAYRWQLDGADCPEGPEWTGTRTPALTVWSAGPRTAGDYRCLLTNAAGTVATRTVSLRLGPAPSPRRPTGRTDP